MMTRLTARTTRWEWLGSTVPSLTPAGILYGFFFILPMLALVVLSFWRAQGFELIPDLSLVNYWKIVTTSVYRDILWRTVLVGFSTACLVVPVAFTLSYLMRFVFERRAELILQLVLVSLFTGYLVRIYSWRTILGKQGLINTTLQWIGLIDEPLEFLIYSNFAVVVTLTGLLLPLALLPIYSSMANVSRDYLEAARDLGADGARLFRTILIPMVLPGLGTAFAFSFLLAAGDFVTPTLVGGTQSTMMGNIIADQFRGIGSNWPLGAALAVVTVACVLVVHFALMRTLRWITRW